MKELSSSMVMRVDLNTKSKSKSLILKDIVSSLLDQIAPMYTSQSENSKMHPKTYKRWKAGPNESFSIEDGIGRQPIEGQISAPVGLSSGMEDPFELIWVVHLAPSNVDEAQSISDLGLPTLPICQDGLCIFGVL
jgi:hypothetical protein